MNAPPHVPEEIEHKAVYLAALEILKGSTESSPMSHAELMPAIERKLERPPKTYLIYKTIKQASQLPDSPISSRKGRNGGYFLAATKPGSTTADAEYAPTKSELEKEKVLEKHLWPLVAFWLRNEKQVSRTSYMVANIKKGGVWSNPDIVGIEPFDDLGFFDVEITTIEVKPSLQQWRYYFFEAVSHKRFSERAYFIYRTGGDEVVETEELKRYAEKYQIGLVNLEIPDEEHEKLPKWDKMSEAERTAYLEYFSELMPAPFEPMSIRDKIGFLKQIGINSKADLYSFGAREN